MRELIVANFLKKYMAIQDPEGDINNQFYTQLKRVLSENVDRYLGEAAIANKSVRVLEDYLWDIARAQSKVLPQIGGNGASNFFIHRQR